MTRISDGYTDLVQDALKELGQAVAQDSNVEATATGFSTLLAGIATIASQLDVVIALLTAKVDTDPDV